MPFSCYLSIDVPSPRDTLARYRVRTSVPRLTQYERKDRTRLHTRDVVARPGLGLKHVAPNESGPARGARVELRQS